MAQLRQAKTEVLADESVGTGDHDPHDGSVLRTSGFTADNSLHEVQLEQISHPCHVQAMGVVRGVFNGLADAFLALLKELVVIEVTRIGRHAEVASPRSSAMARSSRLNKASKSFSPWRVPITRTSWSGSCINFRIALVNTATVAAGAFWTKMSPLVPFAKA